MNKTDNPRLLDETTVMARLQNSQERVIVDIEEHLTKQDTKTRQLTIEEVAAYLKRNGKGIGLLKVDMPFKDWQSLQRGELPE